MKVSIWVENIINDTFNDLHRNLQNIAPAITVEEEGTIITLFNGIAKVSGIPDVGYEELVEFSGDLFGIAFNLEPEEVGVVLLGDHSHLKAGDHVQRTYRVMDVPVGKGLMGRVIDPLGRPLDGKGDLEFDKRLPIERRAPTIMDRAAVNTPLQTGIKIIDAVIPIGRGQRELILGDRQSGKTAIAVDTIINQKDKDVICIYCAIGQRASAVAKVISDLTKTGALSHSVLVVSEGNDAAGLNYIAPYAATSIGEYFMEQGKDVLIVYDDLSKHAWAYREISLLLRRPPGREAFPGDIFYIHSRLLERSTHLKSELGGGSLTALPIVETEAQNLSAYIPTNLISITDGQIYLSPTLFELGILPAIDIGKSVSRVGDKAQLPVYHSATGKLKLEYAQFKELESFARFGTRLDDKTREILKHGQIIVEILKQSQSRPMSVPEQIIILLALNEHLLDELPLEKISEVEEQIRQSVPEIPVETIHSLYAGERLSSETQKLMLEKCRQVINHFTAENQKNGHARESSVKN